MALDEEDHRLFIVCRLPARLIVLDTKTGTVIEKLPVIGDSNDVFYDQARTRVYATGGEGGISVYQQQDPDHYSQIAKLPTVKGARTSYFSPNERVVRRSQSSGLRAGSDPCVFGAVRFPAAPFTDKPARADADSRPKAHRSTKSDAITGMCCDPR